MTIYITDANFPSIRMDYGTYKQDKETLEFVKYFLRGEKFVSLIPSRQIANLVSRLLGIEIPANHEIVKIKTGDVVIIFQLLGKPPEFYLPGRPPMGRILPEDELNRLPYEFMMLFKVK